jgi:hypothetical protein
MLSDFVGQVDTKNVEFLGEKVNGNHNKYSVTGNGTVTTVIHLTT